MSKYSKKEEFVIINIGDPNLTPLEIKLPDIPNDRVIFGYHRTARRQKFDRPVIPDQLKNLVRRISNDAVNQYPNDSTQKKKNFIFRNLLQQELDVNKDRYKDIHDFINREWDRRLNGFWFWNNGVRTYMPGRQYLYCSWWHIDVGVPYYKDVDRRFFTFAEFAFNDPNCYGIIEITKRKTGKTYRAGFMCWEKISRTMNARGSIQSKTEKDAAEVFTKAIVHGAQKMPFFFKPLFDGQVNPKKKMNFFCNEYQYDPLFGNQVDLQSYIDYCASNKEALDGPKPIYYIGDEEGKTKEVDVADRWSTVKEGLADDQGIITGKSHHTSTVEEMEKEGGKHYKQIWDGSSYHKRDAITGQTESGLYRIFIPSYDGYKIDPYGNSLIEKSRQILHAKRKQQRKSGNKGYYAHVRKNPENTNDCFIAGDGTSPFDQDIILKRLEQFHDGNPFIQKGDFKWIDGIDDPRFGEVEWIPNRNGRFSASHLPELGARNLKEIRNRKIMPGNKMYYIAGGDTFNFDQTEGYDASKGGGAVFRMFDPITEAKLQTIPRGLKGIERERFILKYKTNRFVCTYNYRPPSKKLYVEDMIKMCVFYGCLMFPEINFTHIQDGFIDRKFKHYLMFRYDATKRKIAVNSGDSTNERTKDKLFSFMQEYILECGAMEAHADLLNECLSVDYKSMTKFDLFSAATYALYGAYERKYMAIKEQRKKELKEGDNSDSGWFKPQEIIMQ